MTDMTMTLQICSELYSHNRNSCHASTALVNAYTAVLVSSIGMLTAQQQAYRAWLGPSALLRIGFRV